MPTPAVPSTITINTQDIVNKLRKNCDKAFRRVPKIKRNRIIVKLGWMSEYMFNTVIVETLKQVLGERFKMYVKRRCRHIFVFNLTQLEFMLGKR